MRQSVALFGGIAMEYDISNRAGSFQKADEAITQAFFSLLEKKDFDKITVSEIIEVAGVNRSTFYRHYLDKYEILDRITQVANPLGDQMIAPFIKDGVHSFDVMFNSSYLLNTVPQHYKRMFLSLLKVRTNNFDMEKLVKAGFARHYMPRDESADAQLGRELYCDLCYRLLVYSITHENRTIDGHKVINDLVKYVNG